MKSYFATYLVPGATSVESTVLVFDRNLSIGYRDLTGANATMNWNLDDVESDFIMARQQTRIRNKRFPGQELMIDGRDADLFIRSNQDERRKPWFKQSRGKEWLRNSFLFLVIVGALFIIYLLIVPWLSSSLASKVSTQTERQLGDAVYEAMELGGKEDTAASYLLNEFFAAMELPTPYNIRITVINEPVINAFALPGGRIVVYHSLLKQINSYPELAALLTHEFIHIHNKHATRSIFRRLGSKIFLGLLFGKFGSVTAVMVDHADNLKSLTYSRKLEREADLEGLELLHQRKIDPAGFVDLFKKLEQAAPSGHLPEILASHPQTGKRIAYIEDASEHAVVEENSRLKVIFEKIKK